MPTFKLAIARKERPMQSDAKTVKQYLAELPADRRVMLEAVREMILNNINDGFEEGMQYGMIGYYVPHSIFPDGYHCKPSEPLPFLSLASQKNYCSLYAMSLYSDAESLAAFQTAETSRSTPTSNHTSRRSRNRRLSTTTYIEHRWQKDCWRRMRSNISSVPKSPPNVRALTFKNPAD